MNITSIIRKFNEQKFDSNMEKIVIYDKNDRIIRIDRLKFIYNNFRNNYLLSKVAEINV